MIIERFVKRLVTEDVRFFPRKRAIGIPIAALRFGVAQRDGFTIDERSQKRCDNDHRMSLSEISQNSLRAALPLAQTSL